MCTSSTATPAATGGSPFSGADRKTSSGRRRLPPAASASEPTAETSPGWLATAAASRDSTASSQSSSPGVVRSSSIAVTRPPRVDRDDPAREQPELDAGEAAAPERGGEILGAGEATDAGGQVGVGLPAREHLAGERHEHVEPEAEERAERAARARDLEHAEPAAGAEHAAQLAQTGLEVLDVADAEADGRRVEARVLERQREHVALEPLDRAGLAARALEHRLREVEADHLARPTRESARARSPVPQQRRAHGRPGVRRPRR